MKANGLVFLLISLFVRLSHAGESEWAVPADWLDLNITKEADSSGLDAALEQKLTTRLIQDSNLFSPLFEQKFSTPQLKVIETDFAISTKGILGALALRGTPAVTMYWAKSIDDVRGSHRTYDMTPKSRGACPRGDDKTPSLLPSQEVERRFGDSARVRFDQRVSRDREEIVALARELSAMDSFTWAVSELGLDYHFDHRGNFAPVQIGGGLTVRLIWRLDPDVVSRYAHCLIEQKPSNSKTEELQNIAGGLIEALESVAPQTLAIGRMKWTGVRVAIGKTFNGSFVVSTTRAQRWGYLDVVDRRDLTTLGKGVRASWRVPVEGPEHESVRLHPERLARGLKGAIEVSRLFVESAQKIPGEIRPRQVVSRFSMGLDRGLRISLVKSRVALALRFSEIETEDQREKNPEAAASEANSPADWLGWALQLRSRVGVFLLPGIRFSLQPELTLLFK